MTAVVYEPRGGAKELWLSKDPEILLEGPAGTGKTRGTLHKILALADKYKNSRHLLVRKTRESMSESVLVTLEKKVIPPGHPMLNGPQRQYRTHYDLPNGSTLVVAGMDKPGKTFSSEYDTATYFEGIEGTLNEWESLFRALRNGKMGYHQAINDTNPGPSSHWLNQRALQGGMKRILSRHEDNPQFYDADRKCWTPEGEQYIGTLDRMSGHRYLRLRKGLWASAEGVIYDGWDPQVHVVDAFPIPKAWDRFRSIDFGFNNPFCCGWWGQHPDGDLYLYREIYHTGRTVKVHSKQIKELSGAERYVATIADHDAEDRATLRENGIETVPAHKAVQPGIQAVQERMKRGKNGKPRLFIMRGCRVEVDPMLQEKRLPTCTEQEFDGYIWAPAVDGKAAKEEPVKKDDHGMDQMRYLVCHVDRVGKHKEEPDPVSWSLRHYR